MPGRLRTAQNPVQPIIRTATQIFATIKTVQNFSALFVHYGFDGDSEPMLTLLKDGCDSFEHFNPRGKTLTFHFDTGQRFCPGWHDLATSQSFPCPDATSLADVYNQCMHCQRKTGFNPAFYNANNISPQQQARNAQPHFLYLAHFAPGVVKVGISWSGRGIRRLLEQGARSYLIVKEYPNANVARQYESKIAALPGIAETLQAKTKYTLLAQPYDVAAGQQELQAVRQRLVQELGLSPDDNQPQTPDAAYLGDANFTPRDLVQLTNGTISGRTLGLLGSALIAEQNGTPYFLSLANLAGYRVKISNDEQPNQHAPQQTSLF